MGGLKTLSHHLHLFFWSFPTNFANINAKCTFVGGIDVGIINVTQILSHIILGTFQHRPNFHAIRTSEKFNLFFYKYQWHAKGPSLKHTHIRFWSIPSSKVHPHDICDAEIVKKYKAVHKKHWHGQNPDSSVLSQLQIKMQDIK